nr:PREDICTED: uncharacterized protein K02A2.6-like [Megachile rotundata]
MTFGLKNAAQTFQRFMDAVLRGLHFAFCYIDDILIASKDDVEHELHLRLVLERLQQFGISINTAKCIFGASSAQYLGYVIDKKGIRPVPEKIQAISEYPQPKTIEELRRFLGILNFYRRFVKNAAAIQAPLYRYLVGAKKRDKRFEWTPEAVNAFNECKASLANATLLVHPTDNAPLILATDASDSAIGAVLQQEVNGVDNKVADALSRLNVISMSVVLNTQQLAEQQKSDSELQQLLQGNTALHLKQLRVDDSDEAIYCYIAYDNIRPYVPAVLRITCIPCQRSKVGRHIINPPQRMVVPEDRFKHIHLDLIGPLPPRDGYRYCLTMIDRFSRWPEAIPIKDMTAKTVAVNFCNTWITRFGAPATITTDKGSQFEGVLFKALTNLIGCKHIHTTAYHPALNGMVERWHRSLKAAIMCHESSNWTAVLPTVLLGLRTSFKQDIQATAAEMLYGVPLRLPGEFFVDTQAQDNFSLDSFRDYMQQIRPRQTAHHYKRKYFIPKSLHDCTHVFIRIDVVKKPLEQPYEGPYKIVKRVTDTTFLVDIKGNQVVLSTERLKPAFIEKDAHNLADTYSRVVSQYKKAQQVHSTQKWLNICHSRMTESHNQQVVWL